MAGEIIMTQLPLLPVATDEPVEEKNEQIQCKICGKWFPEEGAKSEFYCHDCYHRLLVESQDDKAFHNTIIDIHIYDRIKRDLYWDLRTIRSRLLAKGLLSQANRRRLQAEILKSARPSVDRF